MATIFCYADLVVLSVGTQPALFFGSYIRDNETLIHIDFIFIYLYLFIYLSKSYYHALV